MHINLLTPFEPLELKNSIVMAPMTTCNAGQNQVPGEKMIRIYRDRAQVGLIVAEATCITWDANAYPNTPGIYTDEQVAGWKKVTEAVHEKGGKIFLQLWHAGSMGHREYRKSEAEPDGSLPPSPSGVKPTKEKVPRSNGKLLYEKPRVMDLAEIASIKAAFVNAAKRAKEANFDGVELHAASGYLLDSFLHCYTNLREDDYGGTTKKMCRFVLEVLEEVSQVFGPEKTAIRVCPVPLPSMGNMEEHPMDQEVFRHLLEELNNHQLAYVHACSDNDSKDRGMLGRKVSSFIREHYKGNVIGGGNYSVPEAEEALASKEFDLVYWGKLILANPNLVALIRENKIDSLVPFKREMIDNPPSGEL